MKTPVFPSLALLCGATAFEAFCAVPAQVTNVAPEPAGLNLRWTGAGQDQFVLQYQDTLADGIWRVPPEYGPVPSEQHEWTDPGISNRSRFYRVASVQPVDRGRVVSVSPPTAYNTSTLKLLFTLAGVPIEPQYSVRLYRVTYETAGPNGGRMNASGAFCVPDIPGSPALPIVSYQHGTITQTNKAPSSLDVSTEAAVGVAFATSGYAAVVPDYLGLGESTGLHPYHHARSEATACVDMLRAARDFSATNDIALTNRVFLCGYSQGGHATMALLRELEWFHTNEFTVVACAPMAGAYDLSGVTVADFLSNRPKPNPYYFVYLLAAYQQAYELAPSLSDLLAPPYNTTLPPLLGGNATGSQINGAMPANPLLILKPEYLAEFQANPRHPLRLALEHNDVYRWHPRAPLRFYHCDGDQDVVVTNTQTAVAYLHSIGRTDVTWENTIPAASHGDCSQPSMLRAKLWFDTLK